MKAISISVDDRNIQEIDIEMKPDTVYTFFNSILIDEISTLAAHTIHTDANALAESKNAFFLGEQLLLGDVLITGKSNQGDTDSSIPLDVLRELISYDIGTFYTNVLTQLAKTDINIYRPFYVQKENENIPLTAEWVLYTFNIADEKTKGYFLNELKKSLKSTKKTEAFVQKMASLALNAG